MTDDEFYKLAAYKFPPAGTNATYPREEMIQLEAEALALKQASPLIQKAVARKNWALQSGKAVAEELSELIDNIRAALTAKTPLRIIKALLQKAPDEDDE